MPTFPHRTGLHSAIWRTHLGAGVLRLDRLRKRPLALVGKGGSSAVLRDGCRRIRTSFDFRPRVVITDLVLMRSGLGKVKVPSWVPGWPAIDVLYGSNRGLISSLAALRRCEPLSPSKAAMATTPLETLHCICQQRPRQSAYTGNTTLDALSFER